MASIIGEAISELMVSVFGDVIYGLITGSVLDWLLRRPVTEEPLELHSSARRIHFSGWVRSIWKQLLLGWALGIGIGLAFMVGWISIGNGHPYEGGYLLFAFACLVAMGLFAAVMTFMTIRKERGALWVGMLLGVVTVPPTLFGLYVMAVVCFNETKSYCFLFDWLYVAR